MRFFFLLAFTCFYLVSFSQIELQRVAPQTPNTAALLKVMDNSISHYTGAADINFPLIEVQSGSLSLHLSLSYSSTGNKVEDIASWVGLGWSLGAIPMISRTVRGLADENNPGVSVKYSNLTLDSLITVQSTANHPSGLTGDVICGIANRVIDTEPDIYRYTLLDGRSGTFYWDPYQGKYQTDPYRNFLITAPGVGLIYGFELIDEKGTIYLFNERETSQSSGAYVGPEEVTAWYISKVYNANRTDSIAFGYDQQTSVTKTLNPQKKNLQGSCSDNSSVISTTTLQAKVPFQINFRNGYIQFVGEDLAREDLQGGHALKEIKVFDYKNKQVRSISFSYSYMSASSSDALCNLVSSFSHESKRLFLQSFTEKGQGVGVSYAFEYNTAIAAPCRVSSAQDFWGYFNGQTSNQNLLPEIPAMFGYNYLVKGANRYVNPAKNQFGILKKITYPTGGSREYIYEPHEVFSHALPGNYYSRTQYLTAEHSFSTNTYIDTFTIMSDWDKFLNNSVHGGSFVDFILGDKECTDFNPPPNCAQFYVKGIDSNNSEINFPISDDIFGHRLKKGRYEIKASFGQSHSVSQGFFVLIKWRERDTSNKHKYLGGLRVKEIKTTDNLGNLTSKRFLYQGSITNDTSSGVSLGSENLLQLGWMGCYTGENSDVTAFIYQQSRELLKSYAGSYAVYNTVLEFTDSAGTNGYREYKFLPFESIFQDQMPYKPPMNADEFRSKPISIKDFRKSGNQYQLLNEQVYYYDETFFIEKAFDAMATFIVFPFPTCGSLNDMWTAIIYVWDRYSLQPGLIKTRQSIVKQYDPLNGKSLVQTTNFYYHPNSYELSRTLSINSKGDTLESSFFYAIDSSSSGIATDAWQKMIGKNMVAVVIKEISKTNGAISETKVHDYSYVSSSDRVLLSGYKHSFGTNPPIERLSFSYSTEDRLIEQSRVNDLKEVYIWGYGNRYPVAKVLNTTHAVASGYLSPSILNDPPNDEVLRDHLESLRNIPGVQVEIFTYEPMVGISSATNINSKTTYYTYDQHLRLWIVKDDDGNILKRICYNYAGQPEDCTIYYSQELSQNFTRNCGDGYIGSSVTYTVPAGRYSASSQALANQLAQNEINANGQNFANQNGSCTVACQPSSCTLNGPAYKCVDGICEEGVKVYTGYEMVAAGKYTCFYHYLWSDGSWSPTYLETNAPFPCINP